MLIGISGKKGVGKDTVASIIQYLAWERHNVGISYNTWKSIKDRINFYEIVRFAGKLKQCVSLMTGIAVEDLEDENVKSALLPTEWAYKNGSRLTVRELLQRLGTDVCRLIHPDVWINALFSDYVPEIVTFTKRNKEHPDLTVGNYSTKIKEVVKPTLEDALSFDSSKRFGNLPNWIIPDVRFPNEAEAILKRDGILIRVERHGIPISNHSSETALDNFEFEHYIENDGTIMDLINKVKPVYEQIHNIKKTHNHAYHDGTDCAFVFGSSKAN